MQQLRMEQLSTFGLLKTFAATEVQLLIESHSIARCLHRKEIEKIQARE